MSNDLISRNELLKELESFSMRITGSANAMILVIVDEYKKRLKKMIEEQSTAYDVDKVVERLEAHRDCYEEKAAKYDENGDTQNMNISDLIAFAYGKAIEIVKEGGVNG